MKVAIKGIHYRMDVNTLDHEDGITRLELNQVASVHINTAVHWLYDTYEHLNFSVPRS